MLDVTALRTDDPDQVAGYRIVRRLGQGGQGVVFLGVGAGGEQVAIKRLRLEDERSRRQFAKEVGAARRVAAFCTARVITFDLEGESPYVVSEFIEGPSLQQLVRESGPLSGSRLHRLAIGTVTALAAIHQAGVVHRDLKPANVMVSADGPRVIDFGIARDMSNETTITSRVFGTPAYMAPEQIRAERVSPQTDMFAWASVMAFAATGRAPFDAKHMMAVVHRITTMEPDLGGVPPALAEVLVPCLNKDASRRPTAQQTLAMLLGRPAPVHDAEDPTVVLAEGSRLARAATGDPAGSEAGPDQTLVTAQDIKVGPGLGGLGPVSLGRERAAESGSAGGGEAVARGAEAGRAGSEQNAGAAASGPAAPVSVSAPGQVAGEGPAVEAPSGAVIGSAASGPPASGRVASGLPASGQAASSLPASGRVASGSPASGRAASGLPASGRAASGPVASDPAVVGQGASGTAEVGRAASGPGTNAGPTQTSSTRKSGPVPGGASGSGPGDRAGGISAPASTARVAEPAPTAWSGTISQDAETIPTPVPRPPAQSGPVDSERSVSGDRALTDGARGSRVEEPEFGTPQPLVPAPGGPSDTIAPVQRKPLAGLRSGVGAVLLVLLLGGGMVAGGAIALRALLDKGSPGTGSQGGQNSDSGSSSTPPIGTVLPDWSTGEWSGEVDQPNGKVASYEVEINLQAGAGQGQIEIRELGCAGALTVESATESTVVMTTRLEDDAWGQCVDLSTVQLTLDGNDQLEYAWKDENQADNDASGTLTRQ